MALSAARSGRLRLAGPRSASGSARRHLLGAARRALLPLELTADALVRTMRWEIGQEVTVQRLLWVMEYVDQDRRSTVPRIGLLLRH